MANNNNAVAPGGPGKTRDHGQDQDQNREKLVAQQYKLNPMFLPRCPWCSCDIVKHYGESLSTRKITGCPKCHQSFVE